MSDIVFPEAGPSSSPDRPSLFELLADEQLRDLFHPVIRYVLSVRFVSSPPTFLSSISLREADE